MGFITDVFKGGPKPINVGPQLQQGSTVGEANQLYGQTQTGINNQNDFVKALMGQNGIQNLADVYGQQQALSNQIQGVANGTGPNPALQQLQNTTGQNVSNQAALMASQRGTGANAGLLARQAGMQGANTQQQAVGQGAALSAQQQLNAMSLLGQQQSSMANVANSQTGNLANALNGYNSAAQNAQGNILNSLGQYNNAQVGGTGNYNNARQAGYNSNTNLVGGLAGSLSAMPMIFGYGGGQVGKYASGGEVNLPQSQAAQYIHGINELRSAPLPNLMAPEMNSSNSNPFSGLTKTIQSAAKTSNGSSAPVQQAKGGPINAQMLAAKGVSVPGKAKVKGDSLKNDTVPALLSPGEVVIPRHIMQSGDPVKNSAAFVSAILARQGMKS